MAEYYENPINYLDDYHLRNRIEGNPGVEKRKSEKLNQMECRGRDRVSIPVGLHLVAKLACALTRLQNGITEGLGNFDGLI
ncbi:MAG: hypothetical protein ACE5J9_11060 [Methanosarcinales archaeon]